MSTTKRPELSEVFTYCVWHLDHGVNISLDVIITGLQADDVINNLIHLVRNTNKENLDTLSICVLQIMYTFS